MMVIGIDAHKRSHTAVTIDGNGPAAGNENCWNNDTRPPQTPEVGDRTRW